MVEDVTRNATCHVPSLESGVARVHLLFPCCDRSEDARRIMPALSDHRSGIIANSAFRFC